ncbi:ARS-binding protein 2 [Ceratocystis fimbriata CBS 114723]|uniref:ARS-binding protein 2 n=1 Tax=Ceratocystis fimbriata CBS 114723 TaxID=1035309 RepID=A0A2C5WYQ2_9PEZI|nr:ARS-binding protein 2 [Ceratocystis fimbriata CBS 114723]
MSSTQPLSRPHSVAHMSASAPTQPAPGSTVRKSSAPPASPPRVALPSRNVTAETIEDAFVAFILYCNPAVSPDCDVSALREAFSTLPKSDGKAFSPFRLYELICQLDSKEVKTWVELALTLGVEPPDHSKGQSTQKIQQYAVRLKRWMHSLHVDAFFEYLIGREHVYWIEIPSDPNPVGTHMRDGVPPEDDMALRALLPHIRPRRGRKRADENEHKAGLASPLRREYHEDSEQLRPYNPPPSNGTWHHHASESTLHSSSSHSCSQPQTRSESAVNAPGTTRPVFWSDDSCGPTSAPASCTTKLKKRYGAKAVSSAWRSTSRGKTRGRPPSNRPHADDASAMDVSPTREIQLPRLSPRAHAQQQPSCSSMLHHQLRPPRPNLDVRSGDNGTGRLATSPTHMRATLHEPMRSGHSHHEYQPHYAATSDDEMSDVSNESNDEDAPHTASSERSTFPTDIFPPTRTVEGNLNFPSVRQSSQAGSEKSPRPPQSASSTPTTEPFPNPYSDDQGDPTNLDSLYNFLLMCALTAEWVDAQGQPTHAADISEARGIVDTTFLDLHRKAKTKEAFLVNVAVLAGGKILLHKRPRFTRAEITPEYSRYVLAWEYRLGGITASFTNRATVYKTTETTPTGAETGQPTCPSGCRDGSSRREGDRPNTSGCDHNNRRDSTRPNPNGTGQPTRHFTNGDRPPQEMNQTGDYWKRKYTELLKATETRHNVQDRIITGVVTKEADINVHQREWVKN